VRETVRLTITRVWSRIIFRKDGPAARRAAPEKTPAASVVMAGDRKDFIMMEVAGITLDPSTKMPIVMLTDPDNKLSLPIWIGPLEATAIATEKEGIRSARPMTHDLVRNLLAEFGATMEAAEITELRENTYFARIHLRTREGKTLEIDSRPSDAIAIALRAKAPIYVAKKVLEDSSELRESQAERESTDQNLAGVSRDKWSEILERMSPEDFKYKM
jgi:uncharacterized protein